MPADELMPLRPRYIEVCIIGCVCSHVCVFVNSVLEQMFVEGVCMCDAAALLSA